ncbi:hypothetical protein NDU88_006347 [Pleurodeles waltl]|uniref:Uncharacterized protein n=1 Tax=Pleurodeles waltl TaxID=8319 RepID=A0AAV7MEP8_PLEWA|nr:hypothetical protein NDU88_006347 [Pleurodeles waltl]
MRSKTAVQLLIGYHWAYGVQWSMVMYAGGDGTHRCGRDRHFLSVHSLATGPSTGEDLHCMFCCDLCLEPTMAHVTGERATALISAELERLVDGVRPSTECCMDLQTNR